MTCVYKHYGTKFTTRKQVSISLSYNNQTIATKNNKKVVKFQVGIDYNQFDK